MPERWNPYDRFLHRPFKRPSPPTPVVTLPTPRPVGVPTRPGPKPAEGDPLAFEGREWTKEEVETAPAKIATGNGKDYVKPAALKVSDIIEMVARVGDFSAKEILGQSRFERLAATRQVTMWLCRRFTGRSYPLIGGALGGRDHTTVLHGSKAVDATIAKTKLAPLNDTPAGWVIPLLEAHGGLKPEPSRESDPFLSALSQQALASRSKRGRPRKTNRERRLQRMDERGRVDGGNGGASSRPSDGTLHTPGSRLSADTEASA